MHGPRLHYWGLASIWKKKKKKKKEKKKKIWSREEQRGMLWYVIKALIVFFMCWIQLPLLSQRRCSLQLVLLYKNYIFPVISLLRRVKPYHWLVKNNVYFIVLPYFTFCDITWASSDETSISRLQKRQNTCARVILTEILTENIWSHVGLQPMQDSLSWMPRPIINLIEYHTLVAVYKCTHDDLVPSYQHIILCRYLEYTAMLLHQAVVHKTT